MEITVSRSSVMNKELRNREMGEEGVESRERCLVSLSRKRSAWLNASGHAPEGESNGSRAGGKALTWAGGGH